jgi:2TM domain
MLDVTREGGDEMPSVMLTQNELPTSTTDEDELRTWARKHVERVYRLKRDAAVFLLGMVVLTSIWVLVEWQDNGAFARFATGDNPGDWEPWILYVALIWGFFVALDAVKVYFDRPASQTEIDRTLDRLRRRA